MKKNHKSDVRGLLIKYQTTIAGVLILAACFILTFIFLIPNIQGVNQILAENDALQQRIARLSQKKNTLESADMDSLKKAYPRLSRVLPESQDLSTLFETFSSLEEKNGVTVETIDFKTPADVVGNIASTSATPVWVNLTISGLNSSVSLFINDINTLPGRIFSLYKMDYLSNDGEFAKLSLTGTTFYAKLPTTIGQIDSTLPDFDSKKNQMILDINSMEFGMPVSSTESAKKGKSNLFE